MKIQILKYWRVGEDKKSLILLPSKVGLEIIKKVLDDKKISYIEGIEKIDKASLICLVIKLNSPIKFIEYRINIVGVSLYTYMENEEKFYLRFPFEI
ncbi:MAG TPA: hypothetical protein VF849_01360 [Blattabacteriaceae bacterium]